MCVIVPKTNGGVRGVLSHFATSLINKDETSDNEKRRQASLELKLALDHQVQWTRHC